MKTSRWNIAEAHDYLCWERRQYEKREVRKLTARTLLKFNMKQYLLLGVLLKKIMCGETSSL